MYESIGNIIEYADGERRFIGRAEDVARYLFFERGKIVNVKKFYITALADNWRGYDEVEISEPVFRHYLEGRGLLNNVNFNYIR